MNDTKTNDVSTDEIFPVKAVKKTGTSSKKGAAGIPLTIDENATGVILVNVSDIKVEEQPRKSFDKIEIIVDSIADLKKSGRGLFGTGIRQPLELRLNPDGSYTLIAGETRLRAAKINKLKQVPATIEKNVDDVEKLELQIRENVERDDLSVTEIAVSLGKYQQMTNATMRDMVAKFGKSIGYIQEHLALLKYPKSLQNMVEKRPEALRHAREINKIKDEELFDELVKETLDGASYGVIASKVKEHLNPSNVAQNAPEQQETSSDETTESSTEKQVEEPEYKKLERALKTVKNQTKAAHNIIQKKPSMGVNIKQGMLEEVLELRSMLDEIEGYLSQKKAGK